MSRAVLILLAAAAVPLSAPADPFPIPLIPYAPRTYVCARAPEPLSIDGKIDEAAWQAAPWTAAFVDIEGGLRPAPALRTRAKMLWDGQWFYCAAEMEEPDLWATYEARDSIIYHENDFEVFIDPDGDTHEYYELEINALNTVWDLLLIRPYRDGGPAVHAWDIAGLRTAVHLDGTLNDPSDRDTGWTVEIAFPWTILAECAHRPSPPKEGDQWRVNFSRVEWRLDRNADGYSKTIDPATGKPHPEANWVWSPQGLIAMHYPEMWGVVQFTESPPGPALPALAPDPEDAVRWRLREHYYEQREIRRLTGMWASWSTSAAADSDGPPIEMRTTQSGFEAALPGAAGRGIWHIDHLGRTWRTEP